MKEPKDSKKGALIAGTTGVFLFPVIEQDSEEFKKVLEKEGIYQIEILNPGEFIEI